MSQGLVSWLATWPAETISGHLVTDRFGFLAFAGAAAIFRAGSNSSWQSAGRWSCGRAC